MLASPRPAIPYLKVAAEAKLVLATELHVFLGGDLAHRLLVLSHLEGIPARAVSDRALAKVWVTRDAS